MAYNEAVLFDRFVPEREITAFTEEADITRFPEFVVIITEVRPGVVNLEFVIGGSPELPMPPADEAVMAVHPGKPAILAIMEPFPRAVRHVAPFSFLLL